MVPLLGAGHRYWTGETVAKLLAPLLGPVHEKFLGDGGLYIWLPAEGQKVFDEFFPTKLCNELWNIQMNYERIRRKCVETIPVYELPHGIRFGLARGTIYELTNKKTREREYIGICINLASRLHKYCSELNFIASARLGIPQTILDKHGYMKVIATRLKGFPKEIVIVDKNEYENLSPETKGDLFESLDI